jgi:phosphoglycerol transferase MdoB-like AlkP superfamily enzyme
MPQRRTGLIVFVASTFLAVSFLIRGGLFLMTPHAAGLTPLLLLKAAATGFFFDLATLSYAVLPLSLYLLAAPRRLVTHRFHDHLVRFFFTLFVAVLIFDGCAEFIFFDEFSTRFNFIAIDYLVYTNEVLGNIKESYPLVPIFSAIAAVAFGVAWSLRKPLDRAARSTFHGPFRKAGAATLLPAVLVFGFVHVSHSAISTNSYANELAGNGIYNLFAAYLNNELSFTQFYRTAPEKQVLGRLRTLVAERNNSYVDPGSRRFTRHIRSERPEKRLNVIVVVEESLSAEYLGAFGNKNGLTPNLDQLAKESLLFTNLYASGTRTVRGLEALTLSVPPLPGVSIVKRPNNGGFRSWGEVLNAKGYESKYIYGGYGYFDNMNAFFSANGYNIVDRAAFDKSEITFTNAWGVCDEDLFRRTIKEASSSYAAGKPFFSMLMTTSNHRPFTYPDGKIDIPSKKGRKGGVKYADYAIGKLISESKGQPWFKDTVFVIVADHCASSAGKTDLPVKKYEIPMLVYAPHHIKPGRVDHLMSQIDVAPTILGLMNMSYDTDFLGHDVLKDTANNPVRAFISTYQKLGYLTENELIVLGPQKTAVQYHIDRASGEAKPALLDQKLLGDMLAYYQGSDYLYQNKLNRIR